MTRRLKHLSVIFCTKNLTRSDKNQCSVLIIIILSAIAQFTTLYIFQEYGIKAI